MKSREAVQLVPRDALHVVNYAVRIVAVSIASGLLVVAVIAVGAEPPRLWWRF
jgi:hypothetical protein